jgi:SAM-dependent methyltransferase
MVNECSSGQVQPACAICGHGTGNTTFAVREMFLGLREQFHYILCGKCGCLQAADAPADLTKYYPPSYTFPRWTETIGDSRWKHFLRHQRARHCLKGGSPIGWLLVQLRGRPSVKIFTNPKPYEWLKRCGVGFDADILDVGCGNGELLVYLRRDGFSRTAGVDLFAGVDLQYIDGVTVHKTDIFGVAGAFDLVMMHHSFEHMARPREVLKRVAELLKPKGMCLIRIPVCGGLAWRQYGVNWAQIDAPRHQFLHTPASMRILAEAAGLEIWHEAYDSTDFQFWASEQYVRDISLFDPRSRAVDPSTKLFSPQEIEEFKRHAAELNVKGDGDMACFYLRKR